MKKLLLTGMVVWGLAGSVLARPDHPKEQELVSVQVTYQTWNEYRPWQKSKPNTRRFLGVVVPGNRILVFSRFLDDATLIQVEKFDNPPRVPARILHQDHQAGLALITVDEPAFFDDLTPVEIANSVESDDYYCTAWKSGQLLLADCRWSRVVTRSSSVPYFSYAGLYFITDLEGGGLGEPVYNSDDQLVAMTKYKSGERLTTIAAELIQAYLKAVDMPSYPGFAALGIDDQYNRGAAQAAYYGLEGKPRGLRIQKCLPGGSADGVLLPEDILLELDGHEIDSQGKYMHPRYGRLTYTLIASDGHYAGETIPARILRDGKEMTVQIPLKNSPPSVDLIPKDRYGAPPPYLIAGGFVFRELDQAYMEAWGKDWEQNIPPRLRVYREMGDSIRAPEQKRLIILADVFPDEYNLGYHDMSQNIVKSVNGKPIDSIAALETAFQQPEGDFHVIELVQSFGMSTVILDATEFNDATARIMETYQIPSRIRLNAEK